MASLASMKARKSNHLVCLMSNKGNKSILPPLSNPLGNASSDSPTMPPPTLSPPSNLAAVTSSHEDFWSDASYDSYFDLIDGFLASLESPHELEFEESGKIWCVSDLHVDCAENQEWLRQLSTQSNDAVIVAGDLCTSMKKLRAALDMLQSKFKHVFFVPGNHELWTYRGGPNSLQKFYQILKLCAEIGVHVKPTLLGGRVAVIPMYSWWCPDNTSTESLTNSQVQTQSDVEKTFDAMCMWPASVGDPENPHNSGYSRVAAFFLGLNQRALSTDFAGRDIVSFGHFLPDPCHCSTTPELASILCCPAMGKQIQKLNPCVHIFGHSHVNADVVIDGTRFIQNALGHSKDKGHINSNKVLVQAWPSQSTDYLSIEQPSESLISGRTARLTPIERKMT